VKYGPCSRRRLAPFTCFQDKVIRMSVYARIDCHIDLSHGSVQYDMLKLRGSFARVTLFVFAFGLILQRAREEPFVHGF
jgi:hypothetical protein